MRFALAALLLIGCKTYEDFPPVGGGPGGMTGRPDAAADADVDAPIAGTQNGRVCALQDLRKLSTCDDAGLLGVGVAIGSATTTTTDSGAFTIDVPLGTGLSWQVLDADFVVSVQQLSLDFTLPAIRVDDYSDLLNLNGIILTSGQSSVVVKVLFDGQPLADATVVSSPTAAQFQTRYDGISATIFDQDATGELGVAWLAGTTGTSTDIVVTPPTGSPITTTVPLVGDAITFVTVAFL